MAKYDVTYSCGHRGEVQLIGPGKDRERKLAWYGREALCPACYKAAKDAKSAAENAASAQAAAERGLPALTGSEKQVPWAETIRAEALDPDRVAPEIYALKVEAGKALQAGIDREDIRARIQAVQDDMAAARARLMARMEARWWIDNRDTPALSLGSAARGFIRTHFGDLIAAEAARKAAAEAVRAAEAAALRAAEQAEYEAERARSVVKAQNFRVSDWPGSVIRTGGDLVITASDGRKARGFVDGGDWAVYQIGDYALSSTHPEMERIAREARAQHEASPDAAGRGRLVVHDIVKEFGPPCLAARDPLGSARTMSNREATMARTPFADAFGQPCRWIELHDPLPEKIYRFPVGRNNGYDRQVGAVTLETGINGVCTIEFDLNGDGSWTWRETTLGDREGGYIYPAWSDALSDKSPTPEQRRAVARWMFHRSEPPFGIGIPGAAIQRWANYADTAELEALGQPDGEAIYNIREGRG